MSIVSMLTYPNSFVPVEGTLPSQTVEADIDPVPAANYVGELGQRDHSSGPKPWAPSSRPEFRAHSVSREGDSTSCDGNMIPPPVLRFSELPAHGVSAVPSVSRVDHQHSAIRDEIELLLHEVLDQPPLPKEVADAIRKTRSEPSKKYKGEPTTSAFMEWLSNLVTFYSLSNLCGADCDAACVCCDLPSAESYEGTMSA
jgi:hypothetical protein